MSPLWVREERTGTKVRVFALDRTQAMKIAMLIAAKTSGPEMVRKLRRLGLEVPLDSKTFALSSDIDTHQFTLKAW